MATFDWIPILEGKYMTYYQIGTLVFSVLFLILALLSFIVYLVLNKIWDALRYQSKPWLKILKQIAYISIFVWLGFIPMVCQALDVINFFEGIIGMFAVYLLGIYLQNGLQ